MTAVDHVYLMPEQTAPFMDGDVVEMVVHIPVTKFGSRFSSETPIKVPMKLLHGHEAHIQTLTGEIQGLKLAEAKSAGVTEQLQEQIATLRQDATALNETAARSGERELETRLLLVAAQSENEQLRRLQVTEADTDGSDSDTTFAPASEKPKTAPTKQSRK
jgi:hypothetical protein